MSDARLFLGDLQTWEGIAIKKTICLVVLFFLGSHLLCGAVEVPAGIRNDGYERLLQKYVNGQGLVAYEKWKNNPGDVKALDDYLAQFAASGNPAKGNERHASLVNAYNGLVLQWILRNYPTESIWTLKGSFKARRHKLGGEMVSLNDIEDGALRPEFGHRAHALLVCAARSCPPLQQSVYTAGTFEDQVARAYRTWLARPDLNEFLIGQNTADISQIFKWFKGDFDKAGGVKAILARYAPVVVRPMLAKADLKITYKHYDWGLNDQGQHGRNYKINIFDFLH